MTERGFESAWDGLDQRKRKPKEPAPPSPKGRISEVGERTQAGLACPKCGGTMFKPKRSIGGKLVVGVLAPKTRVKCITCGEVYRRG